MNCSNCERCSHHKHFHHHFDPHEDVGKILLVGNPNVGKSAIFSRLTGVHALSSNYPGTTIGFNEGWLRLEDKTFKIIDVPGAYTLDPTNEAEEVARKIIEDGGEFAIVVLDATALERNLYLAFQVLEKDIPVIIALNMMDETRHKGITLDVEKLEELLGVPVVPTVGVTGQGIKEIIERLDDSKISPLRPMKKEERWAKTGTKV